MNQNLRVHAPTQTVLTHTSTGETLATYCRIDSDGDGSSANGFGTLGSWGVGHYLYIGGGTTAWETQEGLTPQVFLKNATGQKIDQQNDDGNVLVTVTVRGVNGEDFGDNSDQTEAPNVGTYTGTLVLTAYDL